MREVRVADVAAAVEKLFIDANVNLSESVRERLDARHRRGGVARAGKEVLRELLRNGEIARDEGIPLCQDTGSGRCLHGSRAGRALHGREL